MSQKGFALFIILGIVVLFVIFLVFKIPQQAQKIGHLVSQVGGSACSDGPIFTKIPIDPQKILSVTPLGNLNPPDHTIPTDHIYLVVKNNNEIHPEMATTVFSPSDITISTITHTTTKKSGKEFSNDYSIDFSPCKDIQAKFGHVTKLSTKLKSLIEQSKGDCQTRNPRPEDKYTYCRFNLNTKVSSGEEIGEAGGGTSTGLDFWAIDFRTPELNFVNPKRYSSYQLHTVCPIDLFEKSPKDILSEKFGRYEKKRTIEPSCGQINQDVAGTIQGNWTTADGYIDMPEAWSKALALVHDNADPSLGMISIGGIITTPTKIQFTPTVSGTTNRDFNQVRDDQIHCYEGQSVGVNSKQSGRVLIQLMGQSKLNVEYQKGGCDKPFKFNAPTVYQR